MSIFEKIDYAKELKLNATDIFEQSLTDVLLHQYEGEQKNIKISDLT